MVPFDVVSNAADDDGADAFDCNSMTLPAHRDAAAVSGERNRVSLAADGKRFSWRARVCFGAAHAGDGIGRWDWLRRGGRCIVDLHRLVAILNGNARWIHGDVLLSPAGDGKEGNSQA